MSIGQWDKLLQGELDDLSAHLRDEGEIEMEWKQGDEAIWLRRTSAGWYPYHHIRCVIVVPGSAKVGIAIQNQATYEWHPHRVAISSLIKP